MAMYSERYGYLFLLAPRTGSTATAEALDVANGGHASWLPAEDVHDAYGTVVAPRKHTTAAQLIEADLLTHEQIARLHVFSAVRNPFDSLVSLYMKYRVQYVPLLDDPTAFIHRSPKALADMQFVRDHSFSDWIRHRHPDPIQRPRHLYGGYVRESDRILRFESLREGLHDTLADLEAPQVELPHVNPTKGREADWRPYYDDDARRRVATLFALDLDRFGYEF